MLVLKKVVKVWQVIIINYKQTGTFREIAGDKDYFWGDYVKIKESFLNVKLFYYLRLSVR